MSENISNDLIRSMIKNAAVVVKENNEELSRLDAATGDGDHGTTMVRAMNAIEKAEAEKADADAAGLLHACGWEIMCSDGGSTGPLFGSLFMGMAKPAKGKESLTTQDLAEMFETGLAGIRKQSKAQLGDKTMIDALVPAVEAIRAAADENKNVAEIMEAGAQAAAAGAEKTKEYQAKFGRARNLGERSIGHVDAGATSISYIFAAFAQACK